MGGVKKTNANKQEKERNINEVFRGQRTWCCLISDLVCLLENEEKMLYAQ